MYMFKAGLPDCSGVEFRGVQEDRAEAAGYPELPDHGKGDDEGAQVCAPTCKWTYMKAFSAYNKKGDKLEIFSKCFEHGLAGIDPLLK